MALIVRWLTLRESVAGDRTFEDPIHELRIVNRGRPADAHPGASDAREYEVKEMRAGSKVGDAVTVHHARSDGAFKLTERALRALRGNPVTSPEKVAARAWLVAHLQQWRDDGGEVEDLEDIVDIALEAHVEGWLLPRGTAS
ncbi:MAG: hypothetical protein ACQEW8_01275 [Actinomycetota bacterium]